MKQGQGVQSEETPKYTTLGRDGVSLAKKKKGFRDDAFFGWCEYIAWIQHTTARFPVCSYRKARQAPAQLLLSCASHARGRFTNTTPRATQESNTKAVKSGEEVRGVSEVSRREGKKWHLREII